jgi:hypothetical protein
MKRSLVISYMRIAGYHADGAAFARLYVEQRVSYEAAKQAFREGKAMRAAGVPCTCSACKEQQP